MGRPELSVVIPTFGRADACARAVASALAQDVDLEVIVVDDASPEPIAIAQPRVTVMRLAANAGPAAARNAGVAAARAEWIALLDSDDVWTSGSLRQRFEAARAGDGGRAVWSAAFVDVRPDGRRAARIPRASARVTDFASGCWMNPGSTALFMRAGWESIGGQDANMRRLEDYDWLLRWALAGGRLEVHEGVAAEITRGGRASAATIAKASAYLRQKHATLPRELRQRMESYLALERAAAQLGAGRPLGGVSALVQSWMLHPRLQTPLERFWEKSSGGRASQAPSTRQAVPN